jgi:hypothetical protein
MGLAAESVDLYCLVEVAGLAVPLQLGEEVELADLQRFAEGAGWAGSQCSAEEAGLAGFAMVAESWLGRAGLSNFHTVSLRGYSTEYLLHARPNTPTIICLNTPRKAK